MTKLVLWCERMVGVSAAGLHEALLEALDAGADAAGVRELVVDLPDVAPGVLARVGRLGERAPTAAVVEVVVDDDAHGDTALAVDAAADDDPLEATRAWKTVASILPTAVGDVQGWEVGEIVQKEAEGRAAHGASEGLKVLCFVDRAPALTRAQFVEHWVERHTPLALHHHTGLWRYTQGPVRRRSAGARDFDGFGVLHFRTERDLVEGLFGHDDSADTIMADVARFLAPQQVSFVTTEHVLR